MQMTNVVLSKVGGQSHISMTAKVSLIPQIIILSLSILAPAEGRVGIRIDVSFIIIRGGTQVMLCYAAMK